MTAISALSTEYLRFPVAATVNGATVNPTGDTVQFAFPAAASAPVTWFAGSWETTAAGTYVARVLVGPTGGVITLTAGSYYDVYIKITDSPETPVRNLGTLLATT